MNFANKPDVLVWIKFDFENSEFEIKQFKDFDSVSKMEDFYTPEALDRRQKGSGNLFESKSRRTVILKNVNWKTSQKYKVKTIIQEVEQGISYGKNDTGGVVACSKKSG